MVRLDSRVVFYDIWVALWYVISWVALLSVS